MIYIFFRHRASRSQIKELTRGYPLRPRAAKETENDPHHAFQPLGSLGIGAVSDDNSLPENSRIVKTTDFCLEEEQGEMAVDRFGHRAFGDYLQPQRIDNEKFDAPVSLV